MTIDRVAGDHVASDRLLERVCSTIESRRQHVPATAERNVSVDVVASASSSGGRTRG